MIKPLNDLPSLNEEPCVVLDIEVSASGAAGCIIDLAVVGLRSGQPLIHQLFGLRADAQWSWYAERVHGIRRSMLTNEPLLSTKVPAIAAVLAGRTVIGHHIGSDLKTLLRELGLRTPPWQAQRCTLGLAQKHLPGLSGYTLRAVAEHFGIPVAKTHRALPDVLLNREVYWALREYITGTPSNSLRP